MYSSREDESGFVRVRKTRLQEKTRDRPRKVKTKSGLKNALQDFAGIFAFAD